MYRHVESLAISTDEDLGLRLYVEHNNKNAQQTYKALGMINPGYIVIESMPGIDTAQDGDN